MCDVHSGVDVIILRRGLLAAFVLGLGLSITLSQTALTLLSLLWLCTLRDPEVRRKDTVSLLSALSSEHARASVIAPKGLLLG